MNHQHHHTYQAAYEAAEPMLGVQWEKERDTNPCELCLILCKVLMYLNSKTIMHLP